MKKKTIAALLTALALSLCAVPAALAEDTVYGGKIATDAAHAEQMEVENLGDGIFRAEEKVSSGISLYLTEPVLADDVSGEITAEYAMHFNAVPYNSPDKWLSVMIAGTPGVKRPENAAFLSDVGFLLRVDGSNRVSIRINEVFEKATHLPDAHFFKTSVAMKDNSLRVKVVSDAEKTVFWFNDEKFYETDSVNAADYGEGMYLSFCTNNAANPTQPGCKFDLLLSLEGVPFAEDVTASVGTEERFEVPVKLFGYGFAGVFDGERKVDAELNAAGTAVLVDPASVAELALGEEKNFTLRTDGGERSFRVTMTDGSKIVFASDSARFERFSAEELVIPVAVEGIGSFSAKVKGENFTAFRVEKQNLILEADALSALGYGEFELTLEGVQNLGGQKRADSIVIEIVPQEVLYLLGSGSGAEITISETWVAGFEGVQSSLGALEADKDYTLSGNKLTVSSAWLDARGFPEITLFLRVNGETAAEILVKTENHRAPSVTSPRGDYDKKTGKDVTATFTAYSGRLKSVLLDGAEQDGSRWTLVGDEFTLLGKWLMRLENGAHSVTLATEYGSCSFSFHVKDSREPVCSAEVIVFDSREKNSFTFEVESYSGGKPVFLLDGVDVTAAVEVDGKTVTVEKSVFAGLLSGVKTLSVRDENGVYNIEVGYTRDWVENHTGLIVLSAALPVLVLTGAGIALGFFLKRKKQ